MVVLLLKIGRVDGKRCLLEEFFKRCLVLYPFTLQRVVGVVKALKKNGKTLYVCERCGFTYEEREWANKCEQFCTKYGACSLEITGHAVQKESQEPK